MRRATARTSDSDTPAIAHDCAIGTFARWARSSSRPLACSASQSPSTSDSSTNTPSSAARHQASVPGRTCRWMSAISAVSLRRGSITINDRAGIVDDRLQHGAGAREAVRLPRVLADEHRDLGVLVVAGRVAAGPPEELTVDPELAGLLLRERVRRVDDAERAARARGHSRHRDGSPVRRRRNRRSTRRRACRGSCRGARRSRRSRCPSRSSRTSRRRGVGAETSAGDGRSGSGRAAAPSRTCSPQTSDGPCRPAPARCLRPSRRTSMPQLTLQRMHAVWCQSSLTRSLPSDRVLSLNLVPYPLVVHETDRLVSTVTQGLARRGPAPAQRDAVPRARACLARRRRSGCRPSPRAGRSPSRRSRSSTGARSRSRRRRSSR